MSQTTDTTRNDARRESPPPRRGRGQKAVFLDRDGTIIEDAAYLDSPSAVKLLPGVDLAIKSLRQAGYKIIVVTNQSGIARGKLTEETLEKIHAELRRKLAEKNAMLDAIYYCPFHPEGTVEKYAKESEWRKPAAGMFHAAAEALGLDLTASWSVGDSPRDILAGQAAGCRTIFIRRKKDHQAPPNREGEGQFKPDMTVRNLVDAARVILRAETEADAAADPSHEQTPADPYELDAEAREAPSVSEALQAGGDAAAETRPQTPPASAAVAKTEDHPPTDSDEVRREILRYVRQMSRQEEVQEFSVTNLLGGVAQVLVGLCLLLVFWQALGQDDLEKASFWALLAVVFQVMSLTFFMMSRNNR